MLADIKSNKNKSESSFTTKLARPLNLPGEWRASIMDISYPHQWTTIHQDLPYAVLMSIFESRAPDPVQTDNTRTQPSGSEASSVRIKLRGLNKNESDLLYDFKEMYISDTRIKIELLSGTIEEGDYLDPTSIVKQIDTTIRTMYRQHFPDFSRDDSEDIVTYNQTSRKVTFRNLEFAEYAIITPAKASIISMLGHGSRSTVSTTSSNRDIEMLPVERLHLPDDVISLRHDLIAVDRVNLRTLNNVFVYCDIVEQTLIGESQGNILGYFPIKSKFGETGYWCFNPPYDYKTIKNFVDTISIKLTTVNGELFPFNKGLIIIRLLFKRVY